MNKISKYIVTAILSIIVCFNISNLLAPTHSFAASEPTPEKKCISDTEKKKYTIVIIEEPLQLKESTVKDEKTGNEYINRICYRVTEISTSGDKKSKVTNLYKKCPTQNTNTDCDPIQVILTNGGGLALLYGYIGYIYKWATGFVGLIAVAIIIISSAQISLSGGSSDATKSAKDRIIKSLSGLAILFLSSLILYTLNPTFFTL